MKVLYVNWVDYLDPEQRGGGVSLYQRNLMRALAAEPGAEAAFIASGTSYDPIRRAPRWEPMRHGPAEARSQRFDLVNSGTLAPSHASFGDNAQVSHPPTEAVFFDFLRQTGPYDVVHFNNLEGLPVDVLRLKEHFPGTRVVLSLHNYYPFCPQVNFWQDEARNCRNDEGGARCATCLPARWNAAQIRAGHGLAYRLKSAGVGPGSRVFDTTFRVVFGLGRRLARFRGALARRKMRARAALSESGLSGNPGLGFLQRRAAMVARINADCDLVLCVSDRVRQIALREGISAEKLLTNYIGTVEARHFATAPARGPILQPQGRLKMAFFGYMRRDKGFYFLLDALQALPKPVASRIDLLVAARRGDADTMALLAALSDHLGGLTHQDGYGHGDLDRLLADVGLGVLPVLWEDNLPQVAIEMHSRKIPLLTSDLGGARELGNCADFVFEAGNVASFGQRIEAILDGKIGPDDYWRRAIAPETMDGHLQKLLALYRR